MDKQILFNFYFKEFYYEMGRDTHVYALTVDLNGYTVPENCIEEFDKLVIIEYKKESK